MMPYYTPYPQPHLFLWLGARDDSDSKSNADVSFSYYCSIPTHNYAFAGSVLLRTINTDANTIEQWANLNSGATSHFLTTNAPMTNILPAIVLLVAHLPNGARVESTHTCTLDIPFLLPRAQAAHIIPGLASHSLLSIVTMCNAGCTIIFTKIGCTIVYHGGAIVCGHKCIHTGLWIISLTGDLIINPTTAPTFSQPSTTLAANVTATSLAPEYARYVHPLLCSPPRATLLHALKPSSELKTIPGLMATLICTRL